MATFPASGGVNKTEDLPKTSLRASKYCSVKRRFNASLSFAPPTLLVFKASPIFDSDSQRLFAY